MRKQSRFLASIVALGLTGLLSAAALADSYKVDAVHSLVGYRIKHMNVSYSYGRFNEVVGTVTLDGDKSAIDIKVAAKSVDSGNPKRDDHLRGPDFFNAKQFPEIAFKSTKVEVKDDKLEVTGDLTLHGVTKSINITLAKTGEGPGMQPGSKLIGLEGAFTIKRSDYGMDKMVGPIGDEVSLMLAFEAAKE